MSDDSRLTALTTPSAPSSTPPQQTAADSTVAQTLSTALPGELDQSSLSGQTFSPNQASLSEQPSYGGSQPMTLGKKEAPVLRNTESAGTATPESLPGASTENEPTHEKEMNLERLEAQIQEAKVRGPKRVAVASETLPLQTPQTVAQPVVILPLSEKQMNEAKKKSPQFSVKWLWTWCRRQMKKFAEIIVLYREPPEVPPSQK